MQHILRHAHTQEGWTIFDIAAKEGSEAHVKIVNYVLFEMGLDDNELRKAIGHVSGVVVHIAVYHKHTYFMWPYTHAMVGACTTV